MGPPAVPLSSVAPQLLDGLILAWEQANREDWKRFDARLRREREAQARFEAKARTLFAIALILIFILAVVFR